MTRPMLPSDLRGTPTYEWVEGFLHDLRATRPDHIVDLTDLTTSPDGTTIAMTAWRRSTVSSDLTPTVAILTLATRALRTLAGQNLHHPDWFPRSDRLLAIHTTSTGDRPVLLSLDGTVSPATPTPLEGRIESALVAPDGSNLALIVAAPGAEISDVYGSGRVTSAASAADWQPEVSGDGRSGRRILWTGAPGAELAPLAPEWNIWEAAWTANHALVAVASPDPNEDAWYDADLVLLALDRSEPRILLRAEPQLGQPRANQSGTQVSVLVGTASDRGLLAGTVTVIDLSDGHTTQPHLPVHVTSHHWEPDGSLVAAGQRGQSTVVVWRNVEGALTEWATHETFGPGDLTPTVTLCGPGRIATVLESHDRPPTLGVVTNAGFEPLIDPDPPTHDSDPPGHIWEPQRWTSTDATGIDGYLLRPRTAGPHPLVTVIHGGPVWSWRNIWLARIPLVLALLSRGFAVLLPNPRGSQSHGEQFTRAIVGQVGGLDVDDIVSGIDHLVANGVTEPHTVGVVGASYGGFLSAWLATQAQVAAAVAISPATDWVSQHFTTNIPQSDARYLTGDPRDPDSQYRTRSPLMAASTNTSPLLLTAGSLDLATPPAQALLMHRALVELNVDTDIAIYPHEGHDVHAWPAVVDHLTRTLDWLEAYLPPTTTPNPPTASPTMKRT